MSTNITETAGLDEQFTKSGNEFKNGRKMTYKGIARGALWLEDAEEHHLPYLKAKFKKGGYESSDLVSPSEFSTCAAVVLFGFHRVNDKSQVSKYAGVMRAAIKYRNFAGNAELFKDKTVDEQVKVLSDFISQYGIEKLRTGTWEDKSGSSSKKKGALTDDDLKALGLVLVNNCDEIQVVEDITVGDAKDFVFVIAKVDKNAKTLSLLETISDDKMVDGYLTKRGKAYKDAQDKKSEKEKVAELISSVTEEAIEAEVEAAA